MGDNFDPDEFAARHAAIAAEVDAKTDSEYFSVFSSNDAMTTDSEDNVGPAHGLKRKMMSSEDLLKRSTNLPKISKVQLP
eukprot:12123004-Karenia_brevis.AAC.1